MDSTILQWESNLPLKEVSFNVGGSPVESLFFNLKSILEKQQEILEQLINTAREHNRALRQLDMDLLKGALDEEEVLSSHLHQLEQRRREVVVGLCELLGIADEASLRQLADFAPGGYKKELQALQQRLLETSSQLEVITEMNALLTKQALRVNEILLKVSGLQGNSVYAPSGKMSREGQSLPLLDHKV